MDFPLIAAVTQDINLITNALINDHYVCPGMAVFTCTTQGSYAIAWSSNVYIGSGGKQLIFAAAEDSVGAVRYSRGKLTFATLTQNVNGSQIILESTLHINVQPNSPKASVMCIHVGDGHSTTTTFEVIGKKS